jgi:acylpyruvate hydrolase
MRLATVRTPSGTRAARVDGNDLVMIDEAGIGDVGELLTRADWRDVATAAAGPRQAFGSADLGTLVGQPGKIVCVGLNYRAHILEMGRELPEFPTLFAKFSDTLTGPYDDIEAPDEDPQLDWEAELTVVVGKVVRHADEATAQDAIAGYTVANDISMRGYQFRTKEWLQGKVWDSSTPVGPVLVTADEWAPGPRVSTTLNGATMQQASTGDLVHDPVALVSYLSTIVTLRPGDLVLTGTPGGVGHARKPPRYLRAGDVVETSIDGIGTLRNTVVPPADRSA